MGEELCSGLVFCIGYRDFCGGAKGDEMKYPLRTCIWMDECRLCKKKIVSGEQYYDGGYGRRFHKRCVEASEEFLRILRKGKKNDK